MSYPFVSVIIPLYNKAREIRRSINSVLSQTHRDFELIVVDDGSTDSSGDIVRQFVDPRIRLFVQVNSGECAARNRGVEEARGRLIAFLDADDEWLDDFLETVLVLHEQFPDAGLWGTACDLIRRNGRRCQFPKSQLDYGTGATAGYIDYFSIPSYPFTSSSVLIKKEALKDAGLFPVGLTMGGDLDTWIRIALRYRIVRTRIPKTIVHWDADNQSNSIGAAFIGNPPYFKSVSDYYHNETGKCSIPTSLLSYLAQMYSNKFFGLWLLGDYESLREIAGNFNHTPGYRMKSYLYRAASLIPHQIVRAIWKLWRRVKGKHGSLPLSRNIYRQRPADK